VVTCTSSCRPAQPVAQLLADLGVERAERLVEEQHGRLDRQRPGQRHPLALAAGELVGHPVRELREVHELEQLLHAVCSTSPSGAWRISRPKATFLATVMCLKTA
jgi:hypothetical protein